MKDKKNLSYAKKVFKKIDLVFDSCIITGSALIVVAVSLIKITLKKDNKKNNKNV